MSGLQNFETPLKDRDFVHVQRAINKIGAIEAELPTDEDARASNFRERIFQDYATTVFPYPRSDRTGILWVRVHTTQGGGSSSTPETLFYAWRETGGL